MTIKRLALLALIALLAYYALRTIDESVRNMACLVTHENEATAREADR